MVDEWHEVVQFDLLVLGADEALRVGQFDDVVFEFYELLALLHRHELLSVVHSLTAVLLLRSHLNICRTIFADVLRLVFTARSWNPVVVAIPIFIISWLVLAILSFFAVDVRPFDWEICVLPSDVAALPLLHLLNGLSVVVDDVALVRQVGVQEASEYHDLVVGNGDAAELGALLVLELAVQVDQLPGLLLHVIRLREVDPLDRAQRAPVVDGTAASDRVDERLAQKTSGEGVALVRQLRQAFPLVRPD